MNAFNASLFISDTIFIVEQQMKQIEQDNQSAEHLLLRHLLHHLQSSSNTC